MNPPRPSMPDKPNKKVSRACNTCRLKRKKCDGLDPCFFCTENKIECLYSREPRRRGPPSGYLRYMETRVALLETMLGLYIESLGPQDDPFLETAKALLAESKTRTQDVWDAHRCKWSASHSARVLDDLAMTFSPFQKSDQEMYARPLLPPPPAAAPKDAEEEPQMVKQPPQTPMLSTPPADDARWPQFITDPHIPSAESSHEHDTSMSFHGTASHNLSFERTQNISASPSSITHHQPAPWHSSIPHHDFSDTSGSYSRDMSKVNTSQVTYPVPVTITALDYSQSALQKPLTFDTAAVHVDPETDPNHVSAMDQPHDSYIGSYWRTAELALSDLAGSPGTQAFNLPISADVELPPPHILSNLLDVFYQHVHPSFPFLPLRASLESRLCNVPSTARTDGLNTVLLALCAYTARLAPPLDFTMENSLGSPGEVGKVAADLWYEQARTAVGASMRKGSTLEAIQTLLLLGLRDYGKGYDSQAWLLVGMAVRMGQDIGLGDAVSGWSKLPVEDRLTRQNVWNTTLVLDLFLSLQLGRIPAIVDTIRTPAIPRMREQDFDPNFPALPDDQSLFARTISLCKIMSRINLYLYLGFSPADSRSQSGRLVMLKNELDSWHHSLPHEYHISIGQQPSSQVLELNMLYHVAIILLYRPFSKDETMQQAASVFIDAASTFNVLLEKYCQVRIGTPFASSLSFSNPNMIYLIFTASIAHLSGFKLRQRQCSHLSASTRSTTVTLQTQLHLLNSLDALTSIGTTWDLARRCCRTLDRLMDLEGLKPKTLTSDQGQVFGEIPLGKRKRIPDDDDAPGPNQSEAGSASQLSLTSVQNDIRKEKMARYGLELGSTAVSGVGNQSSDRSVVPWMPNSSDLAAADPSALPMEIPTHFFSSDDMIPAKVSDDSIGLGMVWDGEWDETLWAQTFGLGS